jgi:hypothetical protein
MLINSKDAFLKKAQLRTETVDLGDDVSIIVSEVCAPDFVDIWTNPDFKVEGKDVLDMRKATTALIARAIVDKSGKRLFSNDDAEQLEQIRPAWFLKIAEVARRLNGIIPTEEKNDEAGLSEDSSSGSL